MYQITKENLIAALEPCVSITSKRQTTPALANALVRMNHAFAFSATDTVMSVRGEAALESGGDAISFGVSPSALLEAVRRMPAGSVSLKLAGDSLVAKSGARSLKIATIAAADLPEPVALPESKLLAVPAASIRDAVAKVQFAVMDEKRPSDGVRLWIRKGRIDAQVITGYHGVIASEEIETKAALDVLIPPGLVGTLLSATESAQDMRIGQENGALFIQVGGETYRYLSGAVGVFPEKMLAGALAQTGPTMKLKTAPLLESLKYAQMAAGKEAPKVRLTCKDGEIHIDAGDGQRSTEDKIECDVGAEWRAAFNPAYLIPALDKAGGECEITIPDRSMLIKSSGYHACVMGVAWEH